MHEAGPQPRRGDWHSGRIGAAVLRCRPACRVRGKEKPLWPASRCRSGRRDGPAPSALAGRAGWFPTGACRDEPPRRYPSRADFVRCAGGGDALCPEASRTGGFRASPAAATAKRTPRARRVGSSSAKKADAPATAAPASAFHCPPLHWRKRPAVFLQRLFCACIHRGTPDASSPPPAKALSGPGRRAGTARSSGWRSRRRPPP